MPRPLRRLLPQGPAHVLQRGHNRGDCFHSEAEHSLYLGLLQEFSKRHGCAVHAYVLMTNHVHLLVTPPDAEGFSLMMRDINQVFVQHVNRHNHRCGTTWQGRPKTFAVDSESYFLTCQRYVEENPVRARMVEHPSSYPWSSFAINALGGSSTFITPHPAYLRLGSTPEERQKAYRSLFHTAMGDEVLAKIRTSVNGGWPLGTDAFLDQVEKAFGIKAAPGRAGRPKKKK